MKRSKHCFFLSCLWLVLTTMPCLWVGCTSQEEQLEKKKAYVDDKMVSLARYIRCNQRDSIRMIAEQKDGVEYFLNDAEGHLLYWSDNTVGIVGVPWPNPDRWTTMTFRNVRGWCRWTMVDSFRLAAVIPMERLKMDRQLIEDSFSYRPLLVEKPNNFLWFQSDLLTNKTYIILYLIMFLSLACAIAILIISHHGYKKMNLQTKVQVLVLSVVFCSLLYLFVMSVFYIRNRHEQRQQRRLEAKCRYVQMALQNLYFWDSTIDTTDTESLNADLRELAYGYETDIHIYDMSGRIVGSSSPRLFENGILSDYLPNPVFFSEKKSQVLTETLGDVQYLTAYAPFINGGEVQLGYLAIPFFVSKEELNGAVGDYLSRLFPIYFFVLLLSIILPMVVLRRIVKPIKDLSDTMGGFKLGGRNEHLQYSSQDEVGVLVERYNLLVDQLQEASSTLARSEREGAWRTMARQVAHEVNNVLTPMKLMIQQLQRLKGTERFDAYFDKVAGALIEQIDSLSKMATSFSTYAKMPVTTTTNVDVAEKLSAVVTTMSCNEYQVPIQYYGPTKNVWAIADSDQISLVFTNIIKNALQATAQQPKAEINVALQNSMDQVSISIADNGPGIPEEVRDKVFVPNFTTKSSGSGLGMSISKNIVEGAKGQINFETSEKGTIFFVHLKKK